MAEQGMYSQTLGATEVQLTTLFVEITEQFGQHFARAGEQR